MATTVREVIYNPDDSLNEENLKFLREALKDVKCNTKTKSGKVCGRKYNIHVTGYCGCQFHENYSPALKAVFDLVFDLKDEED
jgi:hypothetical protein